MTDFFSLSPFWRCCWEEEDDDDGTDRLFEDAKQKKYHLLHWFLFFLNSTLSSNIFSMIGWIIIESMCLQIPLAFGGLERKSILSNWNQFFLIYRIAAAVFPVFVQTKKSEIDTWSPLLFFFIPIRCSVFTTIHRRYSATASAFGSWQNQAHETK